jgi:HEPN domain-containing protein
LSIQRPEHVAETRDWLNLARLDLDTARYLLANPDLLRPALFHCQQAAEKALKAYLVWHDIIFRRTHDLVELVNQCAAVEPSFGSLQVQANVLTPYAVDIRYVQRVRVPPDAGPQALKFAEQFYAFVIRSLPPEVTAL